MVKDHYVPQTYLRNFCSPETHRLYCISKNNLKSFCANTKDVCRRPDGNTNHFLHEPRIVEDFLRKIEPNFNLAVDELTRGTISNEARYTISGFVSYILTCTPTSERVHSHNYRDIVKHTLMEMDQKGELPPPPKELGAQSTLELLHKGKLQVVIEPKWPQSMGISNINSYINQLGNSHWQILINTYDDNPFITSDNPVALEAKSHGINNYVFPVTPTLAVRICPRKNNNYVDYQVERSFPYASLTMRKPSLKDIQKLNRLIVRSAEILVFFNKGNLRTSSPKCIIA